ncbi:MAG: PIN domain nuclease [Trueperaceae bacterium]
MILVDTSAWIDFLSGTETPAAAALDELVERGVPFGLTEIILQELLQGLATDEEFERLYSYLRTQRFFGLTNGRDSYAEAARLYFLCRHQGITVRSTIDCLIAQIAIENELLLLHNDRDFLRLASVIPELRLFEVP